MHIEKNVTCSVIRGVCNTCLEERDVYCGHERCGMLVMKKTCNVVRDVWKARHKEHDV